MERRDLGRLGRATSVLIYGGAALGDVPSDVADRSIRLALDAGIDHVDTAAGYGDSELHLGRWMPRIRDRIFLSTKTGERDAGAAYDGIRRSLERLATDTVDLIQLHAVCDGDDLDAVTAAGGAVQGVVRAKEEGLAGAIGITGHGMGAPATHLEALRRFPFDTVLTPYNTRLDADPGFLAAFDALAEETSGRGIALMTIKAGARNLWRTGERPRFDTWYEPLDEQAHVDAAVAFVLARSEVTGICTPGDVRLLPLFVEAERRRSATAGDARTALADVPEMAVPFVRAPGRDLPDWLEYLQPDVP